MNTTTIPSIPLESNYNPLKFLNPVKAASWQKLAINTGDELKFIPFDEIVYCKAISNYTSIYTKSGKTFLCCKTLKDIEAKLPATVFIRIHRSYLVNLGCIIALKKQTGELELHSNILMPVSRNKKARVYRLLNI